MFGFSRIAEQRKSKKRAKIFQRLGEISRIGDPYERAESLIKFLVKIERSDPLLSKEACCLATSMMPEIRHQIQVIMQLRVASSFAKAREVIERGEKAGTFKKGRLAEFDKAASEYKELGLL